MKYRITEAKQLQTGLRLGGVGVWRWRIGTEELHWTENLEEVHQMQLDTFDGTLDGFRADLHPEDAERIWRAISHSIATREPYHVVYRSAGASANRPLWIEAKGGVIVGEDGKDYLTGACLNVTNRVNNEIELSRRLNQQDKIQQLSSFALGSETLESVLNRTVEVAAQIFEVPLTKVLQFVDSADELKLVAGIGWQPGLVGHAAVGTDHDSQAGFTLLSSSPVIVQDLTTENRFSGPALLREHGVRSGMSVVIAGSTERPFGVLGVHAVEPRTFDKNDLNALISLANIVAQSARHHEAIEYQKLILREMAHRTGNLLQIVGSVASQTFRIHADPQVALRSFTSRLDSLSRANRLITNGGWAPTRLISLVEEVLGTHKDRLSIKGRDIRLPAELAFDVSLILHELATNSLKYGGLSKTDGQINLCWGTEKTKDANVLLLEWCDTEPVLSQVRGNGFGSKLKRLLIETKWKGIIAVTSEGQYRFSCRIPLPNDVQDDFSPPSAESGMQDDALCGSACT